MWKVCLCTKNKGQSVVHQWLDSAAGSTDQALLTPAMAPSVCIGLGARREERGSFIIYGLAGAWGGGSAWISVHGFVWLALTLLWALALFTLRAFIQRLIWKLRSGLMGGGALNGQDRSNSPIPLFLPRWAYRLTRLGAGIMSSLESYTAFRGHISAVGGLQDVPLLLFVPRLRASDTIPLRKHLITFHLIYSKQ